MFWTLFAIFAPTKELGVRIVFLFINIPANGFCHPPHKNSKKIAKFFIYLFRIPKDYFRMYPISEFSPKLLYRWNNEVMKD